MRIDGSVCKNARKTTTDLAPNRYITVNQGTISMQMSSKTRILEDVLPLRIIREVEKWPVIYTKDNPEMNNPHFKYKVWEEVAKNLFDDFRSFSAAEQHAKVTSLMKKWRNLRDTFKRQLLIEKRNRAGHNIKKKVYVYYKHMSFLLPHMTDEEPEPPPPPPRARSRHARRRRDHAPPPPPPRADPDTERIDEDKHFLLSLLPSFKRMNEDEKLTAKMDILKVIKDVKHGSSMALDTYVMADSLAFSEEQPNDEGVVVKKELLDFKSHSDCGSAETE